LTCVRACVCGGAHRIISSLVTRIVFRGGAGLACAYVSRRNQPNAQTKGQRPSLALARLPPPPSQPPPPPPPPPPPQLPPPHQQQHHHDHLHHRHHHHHHPFNKAAPAEATRRAALAGASSASSSSASPAQRQRQPQPCRPTAAQHATAAASSRAGHVEESPPWAGTNRVVRLIVQLLCLRKVVRSLGVSRGDGERALEAADGVVVVA
jgi:hypothetical protein